MTAIAEKVYSEAMSLPNDSRAEIAERLLLSLEDEAVSPNVSAAWNVEIQRRRVEIISGHARLIPAEEAFGNALRAIE